MNLAIEKTQKFVENDASRFARGCFGAKIYKSRRLLRLRLFSGPKFLEGEVVSLPSTRCWVKINIERRLSLRSRLFWAKISRI